MKLTKYAILGLAILGTSCVELDRSPMDKGTSKNWYSSPTEYELAVNHLYHYSSAQNAWQLAKEAWSDDYIYRKIAGPDIVDGTLNSETNTAGSVELMKFWENKYQAIQHANSIIASIEHGEDCGISPELLLSYEAQARFTRACHYGMLCFHFGDVPYVDRRITIDEAYKLGRTPKAEILAKVWEDFDFAIANLKEENTGKKIATKGAALAMKARIALFFGEYQMAADAAKACMALADKGIYRLHPDYLEYSHARNDKESIFTIPASSTLGIATLGDSRSYVQRLAGGFASKCPSWALFAAYECTDGKRIDQSPLFDGKNPFANRDPRCAMSIIEFGTENLGVVYDPRPTVTKVMNYNTGAMVKNTDNFPVGNANSSYSGLCWKKRVEASWATAGMTDNDNVIIRLADVMLIYAEAMNELGRADDSVLLAINKIRARAYKTDVTSTANYPAITTKDQTELRTIIRRERRVELAMEGLRYYDLIRWGIAKKALNMPNCGLKSDKTAATKVETEGHWFWEYTPTFDADEIPNFQQIIDAGWCDIHSTGNFSDRQYLWPIPATEILINPNITQNPGY